MTKSAPIWCDLVAVLLAEQQKASQQEITLRLAHSEICDLLLNLSMIASLSMEAAAQLGPLIVRILAQGLPQEQEAQQAQLRDALAAMPADSLGRA